MRNFEPNLFLVPKKFTHPYVSCIGFYMNYAVVGDISGVLSMYNLVEQQFDGKLNRPSEATGDVIDQLGAGIFSVTTFGDLVVCGTDKSTSLSFLVPEYNYERLTYF